MAIAREKGFLRSLDPTTQSSFMHNVLTLDRYTAPQLVDILKQRVPEAFKVGAVDEDTMTLIADIASRWGDARLALELLWRAGMAADGEGADTMMPEHEVDFTLHALEATDRVRRWEPAPESDCVGGLPLSVEPEQSLIDRHAHESIIHA